MRRTLTLLMLAAVAPLAGAAAQESRPAVAVPPFENGGSYGQDAEVFDALRLGLQAMLIGELDRYPLRMIERGALPGTPAGTGEGARAIDAATAAAAGKRAGARYVVLGAFIDHYGRFRLDARVIDTETGRILDVVSNDPALRDRRELYPMLQSLASRIAAALKLGPTPAATRSLPTEALTWYSRGLRHLERGNRREAAAAFERALQAAPDFAEAREELRQAGPT